MKEPNFFILGAPKCGTTSLARWLAQHPEVYMSPVKEPHYFSKDFSLSYLCDEVDYLSLFSDADVTCKAVGEASASYLSSSQAVSQIESRMGGYGPRYIVMVRNPVEMVQSWHWHLVYNGNEDVKEFEEAWRLERVRMSGEVALPAGCLDKKLLQYRKICSIGHQLKNLYAQIPTERVLVVFLEDLQREPQSNWGRVLTFLGVSYWEDQEFGVENRSKHWRLPWVRGLKDLYRANQRKFNRRPLGWGFFRFVERMAVKEAPRGRLSAGLRRELIDTFGDDIDLLAQLTGRDLSHWRSI